MALKNAYGGSPTHPDCLATEEAAAVEAVLCSMICVVVRSGSWLSIPLRLCLLPSSCTVTTDGGFPKPMGLGV